MPDKTLNTVTVCTVRKRTPSKNGCATKKVPKCLTSFLTLWNGGSNPNQTATVEYLGLFVQKVPNN
jgi:hypothetical protein